MNEQIERVARELADQDGDTCFDDPSEFSQGACSYYTVRATRLVAAYRAGLPADERSGRLLYFAIGVFVGALWTMAVIWGLGK